jgi:hypothetical protein
MAKPILDSRTDASKTHKKSLVEFRANLGDFARKVRMKAKDPEAPITEIDQAFSKDGTREAIVQSSKLSRKRKGESNTKKSSKKNGSETSCEGSVVNSDDDENEYENS